MHVPDYLRFESVGDCWRDEYILWTKEPVCLCKIEIHKHWWTDEETYMVAYDTSGDSEDYVDDKMIRQTGAYILETYLKGQGIPESAGAMSRFMAYRYANQMMFLNGVEDDWPGHTIDLILMNPGYMIIDTSGAEPVPIWVWGHVNSLGIVTALANYQAYKKASAG